jgi:hypothetical protein
MAAEARRHQAGNLNLKRYQYIKMPANVKILAAFLVGLFLGLLGGRSNDNNLRSKLSCIGPYTVLRTLLYETLRTRTSTDDPSQNNSFLSPLPSQR